ncbi:hypothetical protein [Streptosporangium sp. NPDC048865]|uniref:hypothetical protein n=1 Tax=Streptosporangium sp. NPDC048865 TaxID=3155766 RepID=UPI0034143483
MRRHRFGRPAAFVAAGYLTAVAVTTVVTLVTGDDGLLQRLVLYREEPRGDSPPGWYVFFLFLAGGAQGWALWQILRGRVAGETGDAGKERRASRVNTSDGCVWCSTPARPLI